MEYGKDQEVRTRVVMDEIFVLVTSIVPALIFLAGYGVVLADGTLSTTLLAFLGLGVLIDLVSEAWVVTGPASYDGDLLERIVLAHYGLFIVGYLALGAAVAGIAPVFLGYSVFLLLWLTAFIIGEGMLVFLDDRFEHLRSVGEGTEETVF